MRASLSIPIGVFGLGLLIAGTAPAFAQQSVTYPTVDMQQIPGNISSIGQTGSANAASVEQQAILGAAYANSAQIQQNGTAEQRKRDAAGPAELGCHRPVWRRR